MKLKDILNETPRMDMEEYGSGFTQYIPLSGLRAKCYKLKLLINYLNPPLCMELIQHVHTSAGSFIKWNPCTNDV